MRGCGISSRTPGLCVWSHLNSWDGPATCELVAPGPPSSVTAQRPATLSPWAPAEKVSPGALPSCGIHLISEGVFQTVWTWAEASRSPGCQRSAALSPALFCRRRGSGSRWAEGTIPAQCQRPRDPFARVPSADPTAYSSNSMPLASWP